MAESEKILSAETDESFDVWLTERPRWLQTAAANVIAKRAMPTSSEIAELAELCIAEIQGNGEGKFSQVLPGMLSAAQKRPQLFIEELLDVTGVNAIQSNARLQFGTSNLTVIHGHNGAGKSGYSRLLKHACGSRATEEILSNIFADAPDTAKAIIRLKIGDQIEQVEWTLQEKTHPRLKDVHIFDTQTASLYVGAKNEATYEPRKMRFLSTLIQICTQVGSNIENRKSALNSTLPQLHSPLQSTPSGQWFATLSWNTKEADISSRCAITEDQENERINCEQALIQKSIPERLSAIAKQLTTLSGVEKYIKDTKAAFKDESIEPFLKARAIAAEKRRAANNDAKTIFSTAPLDGIGQNTWRLFWEQARKYSEHNAYHGKDFPVTDDGARCVLCQQELDDESKKRLVSFEEFVRSGLEAAAVSAERELALITVRNPSLPEPGVWKLQYSILLLDETAAIDGYEGIKLRWDKIQSSTDLSNIPFYDWSPLEGKLDSVRSALHAEQKALLELKDEDNRKALEAKVANLKCLRWLSENKNLINLEVERLKKLRSLDRAITLTKTNSLTAKKNELSEQEMSKNYQERFAHELALLGGIRIPISTSSKREGKGKIHIGLSVKSPNSSIEAKRVLSEGETRIVTLAAFLADIGASGEPTPFIFDDPISSLDQVFEEAVAKRLVELAKNRQVIVFTHRLSLVSLLEGEVDRLENHAKLTKSQPPVTLTVRSLYKLGSAAGIIGDSIIRDAKPLAAANRLRDQEIAKLKSCLDTGDIPGYEAHAKFICSEFRVLVENCVEKILTGGVIIRFRRSIETKNKINNLYKITLNDCTLIEDLMTRYSVFEHSQPYELAAALPDFDQIKRDTINLAAWITEFTKR